MKSKRNKIIFISIALLSAFIGLIALQAHFFNIAVQQKEELFRRNVITAMEHVVWQMEAKEAEAMIYNVAIQMQKPPTGTMMNGKFIMDTIPKPPVPKATGVKTGIQVTTDPDGYTNKSIAEVIVTFDENGREKTITRSGRARSFIGASTSRNGKSSFSFSGTDTSTFVFTSVFDTGSAVKYLKKLPEVKTKVLVSNVVRQITESERKPITKRVQIPAVDSMLKLEMQRSGINMYFRFGLLTGMNNSFAFVSNRPDSAKLVNSEFRVPVFSDMIGPFRSYIAVIFPDKESYIFKEMLPLYLLAGVLSLIIFSSFVYVFRIIVKQQKLAVQVSGFINNMTHEFKTPISSIALASEAIDKPDVLADPGRHTRYNQIIRDEISRMKQQVEKILQMAVLEEGDFKLNVETIDAAPVLQKSVRSFLLRAESLQGRISLQLPGEPCLLSADELHLGNVFSNLIDNSLKYVTGPPEIAITVQKENEQIVILFTDNGIGIPATDLKNVFDAYYRVSTGNRHDVKGFGLGLSYVKRIVAMHKGSIGIKSKSGAGTNITLRFPSAKGVTV